MNSESISQGLLAQRAQIDAMLAQLEPVQTGRWVTVKEASAIMGISVDAVRSRTRVGVLQSRTSDGGGKMWVWIDR